MVSLSLAVCMLASCDSAGSAPADDASSDAVTDAGSGADAGPDDVAPDSGDSADAPDAPDAPDAIDTADAADDDGPDQDAGDSEVDAIDDAMADGDLDGVDDIDAGEADGGGPDALDVDAPDGDATADVPDAVDPRDCYRVECPTPFDDLVAADPATLEARLLDRIDDHVGLGYGPARDVMYTSLDVNDGVIECIYTGALTEPDPDVPRSPGGFNTEHSWPQSMGADSEPAKSDLHHLFPSTSASNGARSNWPFGETDCNQTDVCGWWEAGSERGASIVDGTTIFEVRPVSRGNIARAQFYFAVRYQMDIASVPEAVLRRWHAEDPADDRERLRNIEIELAQGNRNPFVDRAELVPLIADF